MALAIDRLPADDAERRRHAVTIFGGEKLSRATAEHARFVCALAPAAVTRCVSGRFAGHGLWAMRYSSPPLLAAMALFIGMRLMGQRATPCLARKTASYRSQAAGPGFND